MTDFEKITNRKVDLADARFHNQDMPEPEQRIAVIDVVGLNKNALRFMPRLSAWAQKRKITSFPPTFPALTCSAQATYLTGMTPREHGIVGNGWFHKSFNEVQFWKQSEQLIHGELLWDTLKQRFGESFTCAKIFWWFNMYSSADWTITPRPMYPADGRKVFDIYTHPMKMREEIKQDLGEFPFPFFWGPMAGKKSSLWIAESAKWIEHRHKPHLSLVYIPHLDYDPQRFGPENALSIPAFEQADAIVSDLIAFYESKKVDVIILSEYGISEVAASIPINRIFREKGWLTIKPELGTDILDCGASRAFALADHQIAHIYINDPSLSEEIISTLSEIEGIEEIRPCHPETAPHPGKERMANFIAVAKPNAWFNYYYWIDDKRAPDFARCVDIHRKPGYDPAELFVAPKIRFPKLKAALFLLKKKLGFRALLRLTPLDGDQVRGSHGRDIIPEEEQPVFIASGKLPPIKQATDVHTALLAAFTKSPMDKVTAR